ncbi:hypothetical protein CRENBAI_019080 [Crenichthys baileyi]|uniref:Uncharacterized protein n=1 Tax=Crenichthys baileyi TaxID=28760 RepID=A0AAV9R3Q7_9TELE
MGMRAVGGWGRVTRVRAVLAPVWAGAGAGLPVSTPVAPGCSGEPDHAPLSRLKSPDDEVVSQRGTEFRGRQRPGREENPTGNSAVVVAAADVDGSAKAPVYVYGSAEAVADKESWAAGAVDEENWAAVTAGVDGRRGEGRISM